MALKLSHDIFCRATSGSTDMIAKPIFDRLTEERTEEHNRKLAKEAFEFLNAGLHALIQRGKL